MEVENLRELADSVVYLNLSCSAHRYPTEFQTYDEAWRELNNNLSKLCNKLGNVRYDQLSEMVGKAKAHYDAEIEDKHQAFLGSWLMQDIEQIIKGKPPFAYPEELYRWPR